MNKNKGITLIALVITIIVLLILAGISVIALIGENGLIAQSKNAEERTMIGEEKEKVELAYIYASMKKMGGSVTGQELQDELNLSVGKGKTSVTYNADETLNVLFNETSHNFNVQNGEAKKVEVDKSTIAIFDTGLSIISKIQELAPDGSIKITDDLFFNLSIDEIKRYNGTPELSEMTEKNIVSWTDLYTLYDEDPDELFNAIKEEPEFYPMYMWLEGNRNIEFCPIYMWFEESGTEEIRNVSGTEKNVKTGTLYWWCESNNVYLNTDSSAMFGGLSYLSNLDGLKTIRTDFTSNMSMMFFTFGNHTGFTNVDALANWNTANVKNMSAMFSSAIFENNLADISGLKNWNTSNVTDMSSMFAGCKKLENIEPLSNWDTSNVTNISYMFSGGYDAPACKIKNLSALSNWDVGKVTNMSYLFFRMQYID
ncbi:MAG: BspA family leucine-rich repeat surface protein [Clostridia bacterium]